MANSLSISQGSSNVIVSTDGPDLTTPNAARQVYLNQSRTDKITIRYADGTAIYLTDFTEPIGSTDGGNVLGVPSTADSGFSNTVNAIPGIGYNAAFDLYDANSNALLLNDFRPSPDPISTSPFSPVVIFQEGAGLLAVQRLLGSSDTTNYEITTTGTLVNIGRGTYTPTTAYTFTLSGYTPPSTGGSSYVYINGYSTTSQDVNGSMNYGQSSFLSSRDSSAKVILSSGLMGTLGSINTLMTVASLVALSSPSASANTSSPNALPSAPLNGAIIADLMANQGVHSSMVNYLFASDFTGQGTIAVSNDFHSNFVDVLISNGDKSSGNTPLALSQFKGLAVTGLGVNVTGITEANSVIGEGSASYQMSAGNETMVLMGINAQVDGGAGIDTVIMQGGRRSSAIISDLGNDRVRLWSGTSTVTGLNTLNNIERIVFTDGAIALDTAAHEHAGQAYLLYGVFNRAPDQIGLGYWIDALDSGHSTNTIAQAFINSNEFGSTNGNNLSSAAFISTLYQNILHRTADAGGHAYWTQELQGSDTVMHRASILEGFAFSSEHVGLVGSSISKGLDYQVYSA